MKKIFYLDLNQDYNSDVFFDILKVYNSFLGMYITRKEAEVNLKALARKIKKEFADALKKEQGKTNNVITLDLYTGCVPNDFDECRDNFYLASNDDYHIVASRYLCGRY